MQLEIILDSISMVGVKPELVQLEIILDAKKKYQGMKRPDPPAEPEQEQPLKQQAQKRARKHRKLPRLAQGLRTRQLQPRA